MKKLVSLAIVCLFTLASFAVPAKRGWQTRTQADGTTIEVQQFGDEFYHYLINRDGKQVREINGMYVEVGEAPTPAVAKARRAKAVARRQRKDVGTTPNLAPKGVVILANFSNKSMQSGHTNTTFNELCNSINCTVNSGYPSAAQYFADQSNGAYRPQFDVFGPVNLSRNVAYYGTDDPDAEEAGDDQHATDAVVEACILADQQYTINWADYDSDNDGYVDFVYVIYAGQGQADGGSSETIWPHNWSVESARYYDGYDGKYCTYTEAQCTVGGKKLDNYAMSSELSGTSLSGIGTLCHEFGHVMGLPDLYDTNYGTNYNNSLTPNDWNIMDGGSYNADGHCPPNYDPWQKDFFGWHTPINLGSEGQNLTLNANGTSNYQAYQINASGSYVGPTTSGLRYYIENRQAVGWDAPLTGHGLLIWKVNFDATKWTNNEPNNTANNPYYTIISASGTAIGWDGSTDNCPKNTFPGSGNKTSYSGISGKPLLNIAESGQVVTLTYIEEPAVIITPFDITWKVNGETYATTQCTNTGKVVFPATEPADCDGKQFVGWCATANYSSATTAPTFVKTGDAVEEGATFYAVFATAAGAATTTWDLVTDASTLQAGDVLVIACTSKKVTAGDISSQVMGSVSSTFSNNQITSLGSETVELTLGGSAGSWTLTSSSGLLGATAAKKVAWDDGTTTWSISIVSEDATIQNGTESYGRFLYNVNSPRFAPYTSSTSASMLLPQLYRKTGGVSYSNYTTNCVPQLCTVRFINEGAVIAMQELYTGQTITKPADPTPSCADYTFAGWWTEELSADNTTAKAWITDFTCIGTTDYYAIYKKVAGESNIQLTDNYKKITTTGELETGNYIVVGYKTNYYAMKNAVKSNYYIDQQQVTPSSDIINTTDGNIIWKITVNGSTLSFYNEAISQYLYMLCPDGSHYNLGFTTGTDGINFAYSVSSGNWDFVSTSFTDRHLQYYGDKSDFAAYTAAGDPIYLFKQQAEETATTYYSSTLNCTPTAIENTANEQTAIKVIRNGQILILRGDAVYTVTGSRLQ